MQANFTSHRPKEIAALLNVPEQGKLSEIAFQVEPSSQVRPVMFYAGDLVTVNSPSSSQLKDCEAKTYFQIQDNITTPVVGKFMGVMLNIRRADFSKSSTVIDGKTSVVNLLILLKGSDLWQPQDQGSSTAGVQENLHRHEECLPARYVRTVALRINTIT